MISARTQLFILAFTLAVAAGGLFIPAPRRDIQLNVTVLTTRSSARQTRTLCEAAFPEAWRMALVTAAPADGLAERFKGGLKPDMVIGADGDDIGALVRAGQLDREGAVELFRLPLVVARRAGAPDARIPALTLLARDVRVVAVCAADSQVGQATRQALDAIGLWFQLLRQRKLLRSESPADALERVRRGDADAAIVTLADIGKDPAFSIIGDAFPPGSYEPTVVRAYPVAGSGRPSGVQGLRDFLLSNEGRLTCEAIARGEVPRVVPPRWTRVVGPFLLSLRAACLALMIAFPLALLSAAALARRRTWVANVLVGILDAPLVIPPVAVGVCLALVCARGGLLYQWTGLPLSYSWQAGALASAIVAFPLIARPMRRALEGVDVRHRRVAETLTPSRLTRFLLVSLPLAGRGITAGLLIGFARAFAEFGATLVVAANVPGWSESLPVALRTEFVAGDQATARLLLLLAVVPALVASLVATFVERRAS